VQRTQPERKVSLDRGGVKEIQIPSAQESRERGATSYIQKVTGYSRAQVNRLVWRYQQSGKVKPTAYCHHCFPQKYTLAEVALLARTDALHSWLSGPATKKILEREYMVFGHSQFEHLAGISIAQIYNLRQSKRYRGKRFTRTRAVAARIGERARPESQGQPGTHSHRYRPPGGPGAPQRALSYQCGG
jgi:hypothetical protein